WAWETGGASTSWDWALYLHSGYNIDFYHNTIKSRAWAGIFHFGGSNISLHNNLYHQFDANVSPYSVSSSSATLSSDNNVFWTDNANNPLVNLQGLYGLDSNSIVMDPMFLTDPDSLYWPTNPLVDNLGVSGWNVTEDLY